jgi:hypothetical protein
MNPLAIVSVKTLGAAGAAALLSLGVAGTMAQAATPNPNPNPNPSASAKHSVIARADRRAVRLAVVASEGDVLGITPKTLRQDLLKGQTVSDLAGAKGLNKEQFETKLIADVKPRLEDQVGHKVITQAQADRVADRISKGYVPFWDGIHHRN